MRIFILLSEFGQAKKRSLKFISLSSNCFLNIRVIRFNSYNKIQN
jgi:hypothetical protein